MQILIVEDDIPVATLLAESVRLQGHEAIVARSGPEALALLDHRRPDAIFLDLVMPEMTGIEVLRRIRKTQPALPVIVITGEASLEQIEEARRLGVTDIMEKPFGLKYLGEALRKLRGDGL